MTPPVIAWLSDFGTRDHYVAAMKAVALTITPQATLLDITHDIAAQDVLGAALELAACYRFFPPGTVFVTIVDPGVGSARKGIAVQAGHYTFVAPDNGVLSVTLDDLGVTALDVVELTNPRFHLPAPSRTFEGRDRFAPVAAWLARGVALADMGPALPEMVRLEVPAPRATAGELGGEVLRVDRFGNAVTNISRQVLQDWSANAPVLVQVGTAILGLVQTYTEVVSGAPCALFSSSDHLEIAVSHGNAARALGLARGSLVTVRKRR